MSLLVFSPFTYFEWVLLVNQVRGERKWTEMTEMTDLTDPSIDQPTEITVPFPQRVERH